MIKALLLLSGIQQQFVKLMKTKSLIVGLVGQMVHDPQVMTRPHVITAEKFSFKALVNCLTHATKWKRLQ